MTALLTAVLVASLLGSLHCVGMCGGIVALCMGSASSSERSPRLLAAYNGGRLVTYAALGVVSGAIGKAVDLGGGAVGLPRLAATVAGALMIAAGLVAIARTMGIKAGCARLPAFAQRWLQRGMSMAMSQPPVRRSAIIGLLTGFLPCGWLYAFVAAAATTGDPLWGAAVMTAFWLGTVPALLAVGFGVRLVAKPLQRHLPTVGAFCMLVVGVVAVVGRLNVPSYTDTVDARFATVSSGERSAVDAASDVPACCAEGDTASTGGPAADPATPELDAILEAATAPPTCCEDEPAAGPPASAPAPAPAPPADADAVRALIDAAAAPPACCGGEESSETP